MTSDARQITGHWLDGRPDVVSVLSRGMGLSGANTTYLFRSGAYRLELTLRDPFEMFSAFRRTASLTRPLSPL